jgi:hypothetical protein
MIKYTLITDIPGWLEAEVQQWLQRRIERAAVKAATRGQLWGQQANFELRMFCGINGLRLQFDSPRPTIRSHNARSWLIGVLRAGRPQRYNSLNSSRMVPRACREALLSCKFDSHKRLSQSPDQVRDSLSQCTTSTFFAVPTIAITLAHHRTLTPAQKPQ